MHTLVINYIDTYVITIIIYSLKIIIIIFITIDITLLLPYALNTPTYYAWVRTRGHH